MAKKTRGYKMKSSAYGGPMRRNFASAFKKDEPTEAELIAQAEKFGNIDVSGGKQTEPGKFIQYPTGTGADSEGASVTGSSIEHTKLRKLSRDPDYKMTSEERARLRELNLQTEQAYKTKVKEERKKKGYE
tara:strand:+ start:280 stop:672 length:393 start_codon:yes stop_codon:yes gene_type:complete